MVPVSGAEYCNVGLPGKAELGVWQTKSSGNSPKIAA